jgi:hypothetical protein
MITGFLDLATSSTTARQVALNFDTGNESMLLSSIN